MPSLGISPASIDAKVKRASSYTQNFTLSNSTNQKLRITVSLEDMWYDEQNKRLVGRPGTLPRSASPWIQLIPGEVVVEPHSSVDIKAVITVPSNAAGSYYAVPVFNGLPVEKPTTQTSDKTTSAVAKIGIRFRGLIMLTTTEGSEYNFEIKTGKITPPTASSEMEMALDINNRGTAQARIRGSFAILNASGTLAGRGSLTEKNLLPSRIGTIKGNWAGELPAGNYTGIVTLSYDRIGLDADTLIYEIPFTVK